MSINKEIKPRLECNRELLAILSDYLEENPDMRFSQALINLNIVQEQPDGHLGYERFSWKDEFYLESVELLWRVKEAMGINE